MPGGLQTKNKIQFYEIMIRKTVFYPAPAVVLAGALALSAGCGRAHTQQRQQPPAVTVAPVEQKEIVEWSEFTGRVEPV